MTEQNTRYHDRILPAICKACYANKLIIKPIAWEEGTLKVCDECWAEAIERRQKMTSPHHAGEADNTGGGGDATATAPEIDKRFPGRQDTQEEQEDS